MRKWLPSKKTVGVWVGAALVAVLAIPASPFSPQFSAQVSSPISTQPNSQNQDGGAPAQSYPHTGAIPTLSPVAMTRENSALDDTIQVSETQGPIADSPTSKGAQPVANGNTNSTSKQGNKAGAQPGSKTGSGSNKQKNSATPNSGSKQTAPSAPKQGGPSAARQGSPSAPKQVSPSAPGATPGGAQAPGGTAGTPQAPGATPGGPQVPGGQAPAPTTPGAVTPPSAVLPVPNESTPPNPFTNLPTAQLRIRVIDGRSLQALPGAEVVVIETEQRIVTDKDGYTPYIDVPIIRNPRYRPMIAELHGQLGVIAYKNGYRDSIHLGIRVHEGGSKAETTVWMYKIGPGDARVEPVLYQVPYHHLWLVELADKFRSKTQPGEGPERP